MPTDLILEKMRSCISSARKLEPTCIDARARCFVSNLSGALHEVDPSLAAELFYVLINAPTIPEQRCVSNHF